ncbi:diaminopropionate ammonia-lyase [Aminobacter sp. NyZ550]|jgi:diaminopropionate ammonia-lyase|uniref:diaminopropionate ammonia-lyase n=1 Tax=Aminobacter sp. NyZ550 TaxID=2979870 RepID=UPI0021D5DC26|nr:diaminopropionate ammonia-lyase [Aminobacter sp. NyZ550]WAX96306.1 diaminopropionate ammonia-lyase [Aminobacter sp. NyZ550]
MKLVENRSAKRNMPLSATEAAIAGVGAPAIVREFLPAFPIYAPTPLESLPGLAATLGIASVDLKDEGHRYGLYSFKALGGAYAVARLVRDHAARVLGRDVEPAELLSEAVKQVAADLTVCCATDGNHGRSVAAGAQMFGCRCVIFLHSGVSVGREKAIAGFGAEIRRTDGNYDQSVAEASETANREGWTTVSDFAWEGYTEIPGMVMQGYTLMLGEISAQARQPYTHVFIQGGVGGLAAVVAGYFLDRDGASRPKLIVVEPDKAACLQMSAAAGKRMSIEAGDATVMAMLECYEPSLTAWEILEKSADYYLDVGDGAAVDALRKLARPVANDPALRIGESGVAGLAGLIAAAGDPSMRATLGLDAGSHILLIGTEGATDPELYEALLHGAATPAFHAHAAAL